MTTQNPRRAAKKTTVRKVLPKQTVVEKVVPEAIEDLAEEAMTAEIPVQFKRLTHQDIVAADDITEEEYVVPEWNGSVLIRSLTARKMMQIMDDQGGGMDLTENGVGGSLDLVSMQRAVITSGVIDPIVTNADFELWMEKSAAPVMNIFKRIMTISKMRGNDENGNSKALEDEIKTFRAPEEQ